MDIFSMGCLPYPKGPTYPTDDLSCGRSQMCVRIVDGVVVVNNSSSCISSTSTNTITSHSRFQLTSSMLSLNTGIKYNEIPNSVGYYTLSVLTTDCKTREKKEENKMGNGDTICCFGPRSWAKIIARIQIMLNTAGFILFTIVLTGLLELGQNGFNQAGVDGKQPAQVTNMTYYGCLAVLLISLGVFIIGAFFGLFLFKGAYESKTTYLKWWIVYAVVCSCWSMFYTIFDPDTLKIILMILSAVMYGFGIYVVRCLIQEILEDRKMRQERMNCKSRLLRTHQPLTYKYTLLNV